MDDVEFGDPWRAELKALAAAPSTPPRQALRARIVLASLAGEPNNEVARKLEVSAPTVALWRRRYDEGGIDGLRDRPRSGRPRFTQRSPKRATQGTTANGTPGTLSDAELEQLLEAASRTIAKRGFGATRVADIADEAGVSPATIHYYFKTKEDILIRALLWANARLMSHVEASSSDAEDPLVSLAKFIERTIPYSGIQREEYLLEIDLWSRVRLHPELLPAWEEYCGRWIDHVAAMIRAGIESGRFTTVASAHEIAERLATMTDGVAAQAAIGAKRMPPQRAREIILRFAAEQLGVDYELLERSAHLPDLRRRVSPGGAAMQ